MKHVVILLVLCCSLLSIPGPASAHNDMMGGSKWFFGKDNVTAVMEVAPALLAKIKGIAEGHYAIETCSDAELQVAVAKVIQPYLDRKLSLSVNEKRYPVKVRRIDRKNDLLWDVWLYSDGIRYDRPENNVKIGYELFFDETDDIHFNLAYMYAFDAATQKVPENIDDSKVLDRYTFDVAHPAWETAVQGPVAAAGLQRSFWANCADFIVLGIKHILTGYDHMAFLLALIVVGLSFRQVFTIITSFTVAHSVTLLLSALEIVTLNPRLVEIVIATSICYIAVENLVRKEMKHRWLITFAFGLIHGFGFASILRELIKNQSSLLPSVVSFNVGVEIGQVMIFLVMIPVLHLAKRRFEFSRVAAAVSMAVLAIGFAWLAERVFDIKFLPL